MEKMVVSDYDQTFNMGDYSVKYNIDKTNKFLKNGNIFTISTGRNFNSIKNEINKYGINYSYLCCCDGGEIYDSNDKLLYRSSLAKDDIDYISEIASKYPNANILKKHIIYGKVKDIDPLVNIIQFKGIKGFFETEDTKSVINEIVKNDNLSVAVYLGNIFVSNKDANKSRCVEVLSDMLNISKLQIFTIGDYKNDYEMVRDYNGFAMAWAVKKVKNEALGIYFRMGSLEKDVMLEKESFVRKLKYK